MTDMTAAVQKPGLIGIAPTYTTCTAADKFLANSGGRYMLHYKNGVTPTGALKITDQTSAAQQPAGAVLSAGWADAATVPTSIAASGESVVWMDTPARFKDGSGFVNLVHVTPTTLTVAIFGPF